MLSAAVWPGAGQLRNGHMLKGFALILATGLCLLGILHGVLRDVLSSLPADDAPPDLVRLASVAGGVVERALRSPWNLVLLGIWTFAVADAYRGSRNSTGR